MRSWRHLFVVCCLSLLVAEPALAASRPQQPAKPGTLIEYVLLCGLINLQAGQAVLTSPPDHSSVSLSNVSNTGQDGLNIALSHMDGASVHLTANVTDADNDASCSFSYHWSIASAPASGGSTVPARSEPSSLRSAQAPGG